MFRVKLVVEYDGSNYVGWQRQNNGKSICIYEEGNKKSLNIAKKLFSDGRVHHVVKNDYRDKSKIDRLIKNIIKSK